MQHCKYRSAPILWDQSTRMLSNVQLFAVYAQESAMRVLLPTREESEPPPRLTPQEIDCLRWTMKGKTLWESAAILNIAERTAQLHIGTAVRKLSSVNAPQAVLKALRLGLIR